MYKKDDRLQHQKSWFFNVSKLVLLPLDIWLSRKALTRLLQNIYLMLDLLNHKCNPLVKTVADN